LENYKSIDLDYLIAVYLKECKQEVEEQVLVSEVLTVVEKLYCNEGLEINDVSFERDIKDNWISPEIVSSLKRLKRSGLVNFILETDNVFFCFKETEKKNCPSKKIIPSHEGSLGKETVSIIKKILKEVIKKGNENVRYQESSF